MKNKHKQVLNQIKEDWRSYLIGVGSCYPPNEEEYKLFFERMVANITDAETIEPKHPVFYWRE
jgi:hypothetical protein